MPSGGEVYQDPLADEAFVADVMREVSDVTAKPAIQRHISRGLFTVEQIGAMAAFLEAKAADKPKAYLDRRDEVGQRVAKIVGLNDE